MCCDRALSPSLHLLLTHRAAPASRPVQAAALFPPVLPQWSGRHLGLWQTVWGGCDPLKKRQWTPRPGCGLCSRHWAVEGWPWTRMQEAEGILSCRPESPCECVCVCVYGASLVLVLHRVREHSSDHGALWGHLNLEGNTELLASPMSQFWGASVS